MSAEDRHPPPDYLAASDIGAASPLELAAANAPHAHHAEQRDGLFHGNVKPKRLWKQFAADTLTAALMHSVEHNVTLVVDDATLEDVEPEEAAAAPADFMSMDNPYIGMEYFQVVPEGGSLGAAIFGLIKGTVGPAILYLPRGFQNSGYAVAIPSMVFATIMYVYNAYRLLACWKVEHDKDIHIRVGEHCHTLLTYPELARRAFGPLSVLVDVGIAALQFGVCLTYLIFVPHNLVECTEALFGVEVDKAFFLVAMLVVEIPLGWIRDITKLTPTNVLATGLIAYGLFFVIVLAFIHGMEMMEDGRTRVFAENLANLPAITDAWYIFVGTSFFMMEGSITLVVPLQESIQRAKDRAVFPQTNQTVTICIVIFYVVFSIICCGGFGDEIQTALTASLDGVLATTIQLAYSVAVILTFPLQAFPAMEVVKNNLLGEDDKGDGMSRRILSTLVICLLGIVAICAIDYLGNVVSILGSLFGIPLALVVPPLMHNILITDSSKTTRWMNYGVVVIGFIATGAASFATIVSWDKGAEVER